MNERNTMNRLIILEPDASFDGFFLNMALLGGLENAQLWIGPDPEGPLDNDDEQVLERRKKADESSKLPGGRISGIEAQEIEQYGSTNWWLVRTEKWVPGIYRFNVHSHKGVLAPNAERPLHPEVRDFEYSWPNISAEVLQNLPPEQRDYLYLELNKAGYCFRITIKNDRKILPAGNGREWVDRWPEILKEVQAANEKRIADAKKKKGE